MLEWFISSLKAIGTSEASRDSPDIESSSSLCILLPVVTDGNTLGVICLAFKLLFKTWLHGYFSCSLDISRMFGDSINVSSLRPQKEDFIKSLEYVTHPELYFLLVWKVITCRQTPDGSSLPVLPSPSLTAAAAGHSADSHTPTRKTQLYFVVSMYLLQEDTALFSCQCIYYTSYKKKLTNLAKNNNTTFKKGKFHSDTISSNDKSPQKF